MALLILRILMTIAMIACIVYFHILHNNEERCYGYLTFAVFIMLPLWFDDSDYDYISGLFLGIVYCVALIVIAYKFLYGKRKKLEEEIIVLEKKKRELEYENKSAKDYKHLEFMP